MKGDGFVEFTTSEATTHKMAGLSHGNTNTDFADLDFGVLLASNGTVYVFEGGASRGVFGTYLAGDRFRVAVEGGVVRYRRNGVLFYTSAVAPAYPLLVDTALFSPAATIADVVLSGDLGEAVAWTATAGVSASSGTLTKTAAAGWNAGAISTRAIASGDGFVSFTHERGDDAQDDRPEPRATRTRTSPTSTSGSCWRRTGRTTCSRAGRRAACSAATCAGDRFQVAVEGGVVKYLKNGAVFYTSGVAPAYPLLVDTALYTPGATLIDVVLGCVSASKT